MKRIATAIAVAALAVPAAAQAATASSTHAATPAKVTVVQREVRITGKVTKLTATKITVANAQRSRTFVIPTGFNLRGIQKGDRVQAEGEKEGGTLVLRSIHQEDSAAAAVPASATYSASGSDDRGDHNRGDDHGHDGGGHR